MTKPNRPKSFDAALALQAIAIRDCGDPETKPHIRAALMRAWCDLEEIKRLIKMKPAPKPIDVSGQQVRRRPLPNNVSFIEPGVSTDRQSPPTIAPTSSQGGE